MSKKEVIVGLTKAQRDKISYIIDRAVRFSKLGEKIAAQIRECATSVRNARKLIGLEYEDIHHKKLLDRKYDG